MSQGFTNSDTNVAYPIPVTKGGTGANTAPAALTNLGITITTAASQTDQVAATSNALIVTPAIQKFHPSAAKAWVRFNAVAGATTFYGYNISSVGINGTGNYTIFFTIPFSTATFTGVWTVSEATGLPPVDMRGMSTVAQNYNLRVWNTSTNALIDPGYAAGVFFGSQ